jgi:hypothetical protein
LSTWSHNWQSKQKDKKWFPDVVTTITKERGKLLTFTFEKEKRFSGRSSMEIDDFCNYMLSPDFCSKRCFLILTKKHAMASFLKIRSNGTRTLYFFDPEGGIISATSRSDLKKFFKKYYPLSHFYGEELKTLSFRIKK